MYNVFTMCTTYDGWILQFRLFSRRKNAMQIDKTKKKRHEKRRNNAMPKDMEAYRDPPNVELQQSERRCKYDDLTEYIHLIATYL